MTPYNGLTVINTTTNCVNYYVVNNWFEACGTCTPQATVAFAGKDTLVSGGATSLNLYANTPETGNGLWSILSGVGGIVHNATSPNSLFTGVAGITYTLQWTITNSCATSSDVQTVMFGNCQVGETYAGGIIAYILQPGDPGYVAGECHGLIAAPIDQSPAANWGCWEISIPGTSTAFGTGQANTILIVNGCSEADCAARICSDLMLNGYDDWFLPSLDELNQLYVNRAAIGGFESTSWYWSSSEYDINSGWGQEMGDYNYQAASLKYFAFFFRAVRAF